ALSLVLVTISVYAVQVFAAELTKGPGFRTTQIAKVTLDPSQARYDDAQSTAYFETAAGKVRALPGVESVALTSSMPLFSFNFASVVPEGVTLPEGQDGVAVWANSVDEQYFETMAIPG